MLPIAFAAVRNRKEQYPEKTFRGRLISAFDDRKILAGAIATVERMVVRTPGPPTSEDEADA